MASKVPQVTIIGAGLSGLALGLGLRSKGITAVLYDRAASAPRYNYGVTLYPSTYRPLLGLLDMDEAAFREFLSVNAQQQQQQQSVGAGTIPGSNAFRCHRGRLEALISRSLSIKWDKKLKGVKASPGSRDVTAAFEDGEQHKTTCLIGCDGPHSTTRQILAPSMKLEVLPYVTFSGKRRMSAEEYAAKIQEHMQGHAIRQTRVKDVLLEVSVANINGSRVELSYVYSRPARAAGDPLHHPDRSLSGATDVPKEFYDELGDLADLEMPFKEIFVADKVREDRTLHWLMRCLEPERTTAEELAGQGVLLIGDAVHATPILGGEGAQLAIQDGLDLAEYIAANGIDDLGKFTESKFGTWTKAVGSSRSKIEDLHSANSVSV